MGLLEDRTAIVTGGARGIGAAIAEAFNKEGAQVAIADRNEEGAKTLAETLGSGGARAIAMHADVTNQDDVERMVGIALAEFGRVDVLVNNAGIDTISEIVDMPFEQWQEMIDVNLTSVFRCTQAVLPAMISQHFGRIINIGSQLAMLGTDTMVHYCAAKAGVHGFTKALAREVARHNITVNVIAPGPIETELLRAVPEEWLERKRAEIPLRRFGRVEEIAPTAVLLASDGGSYYTGSTLNVSGGDVMI
jgi:3-oxoacyl-[acyl-carrier protein] reductase